MIRGALFALGFRPFYLLAGAYAALSVGIWALQYAGWLPGANFLWHAHEMLFGYTFAVITGFLFTAVRNWTGLPTPTGAGLAAIAALWVAARALAVVSLPAAALADAAFALAVAWGIGRPLLASGNRRNLFFIALVLALGAASVGFHAWPRLAFTVGLDVVLFVMAVVAGRVVPMFTNNAVPGAGARQVRTLEMAALGSVLVLLILDAFEVGAAAAAVALVAALLHGARLALWTPMRTWGRPILWILHLSYAWIVVHLALRGLAGLDLIPGVVATHALTVGAIGGLTLGMMTRTARGHTARPLVAGRAEVAAYVLVHAAAAVRVLVPLIAPAAYAASIALSAALWSAAFVVFTAAYYPILSRPRLDGKPG
ncbi:MAG: NnrS family protein [Betaproteobacteria bacterium]|nr:NnrS family protein [Betaproteobacteria bacterium]